MKWRGGNTQHKYSLKGMKGSQLQDLFSTTMAFVSLAFSCARVRAPNLQGRERQVQEARGAHGGFSSDGIRRAL